ncbi:DUF4145 domain-containing protein [Nostoc commune]|uniref:DUF4145 domain-containing protein n=1 Tax=Nostoc commune TaxID=1178 RepID=UPI0018C5590F|nr:DUF4145 domain-containing protein [Nostoc commune]MBG1263299.1 DUF4145 domain-containing protein [Nostoc commune BAE]
MILNCLNCKALVDAQEISNYKNDITDAENYQTTSYGNELLSTYEEYTLLKCPSCFKPFLNRFIYDNEYGYEFGKLITLYPVSNKIINSEVPISIKKAFDEALCCFENKIFTACVIMCRKAIEGVCKEYKIEKGNLKDKLILMKKEGIIDQNIFDWADALRLSGNDAAHDLDVTFSLEDAEDIIEFTYAIIEYVFTYREKFILFIERKKSKNSLPTHDTDPTTEK